MADPRRTTTGAPDGSDESGAFPSQDAMFNNLTARTVTILPSGPYTPTASPGSVSIPPFAAEPLGGFLQLGTGTGGGGNAAVASQIQPSSPNTFISGTTLTGTDTTHVVIAGNHTGLVGYYYVATGVANNPSVPLVSATFDGTNTTFVISFITGNTNGITYEISLWPGGSTGRTRTGDTRPPTIFKPTAARTFWQIGPNTALYQVDTYGTLYLIGLNGTGANLDHFRDLRVGDLGCDAIENDGTSLATGNPGGTEPGPIIEGYLGYNGAAIKLFTDPVNSPRTKTFEAGGIPGTQQPFGNVGIYAAGAVSGAQQNTSPKLRLIGTEWAGGVGPSTDRVAYFQDHPTDTAGSHQLEIGFENRGSPTLLLVDAGTAALSPNVDLGINQGGVSNRFAQFISGPNGFRVWQASGDANPIIEVQGAGGVNAALLIGAGGASAVDTAVQRNSAGIVGITTGLDKIAAGTLTIGATTATGITLGSAAARTTLPIGENYNFAATAAGTGGAPTLPANTPTGAAGGAGKWIACQLQGATAYLLVWQ